MENNMSSYDALYQDVEFARQVADIHRTASATLKAVDNLSQTTESQKDLSAELSKKIEELTRLIERAEGQLIDLRGEREALQEDIKRHESVLEEMQRLEESFNGALTAYGNIANVYSIFDARLKSIETAGAQNSGESSAKSPIKAPAPAPVKPRKEFKKLDGVDYDEVTSVEKLFSKYNGKIGGPVVVVRTKTFPWSGDYCMAIKSIGNGKAWGVRYSYGQPGKKSPLNATEEEYSMYAGEYYWEIAEDFKTSGK